MIEWTELSERSEKKPSAGAGVQGEGAEPPEACILHTIAYYVGNYIPNMSTTVNSCIVRNLGYVVKFIT